MKPVLISASAGSGKTHRLMEIVLEEVEQGLRAEGLIASTFTVKAADELKHRIREKLVEAGRVRESRAMALARIGTVHSVCADLIRRFAFDQGASIRQEIITEEEQERIFREALNEALNEDDRSALRGFEFRFTLDAGDIEKRIRTIVDLARQNDIDEEALAHSCAASIALIDQALPRSTGGGSGQLLDAVRGSIEEYCRKYPEPTDPTDKTSKAHAHVLRAGRNLAGGGLSWRDLAELSKLEPGVKSRTSFAGVIDQAKSAFAHPDLRRDLEAFTGILFEAAKKAMAAYARRKASLGRLDYSDLEQQALRLLDDEAVRAQLSSELQLLLVDEFQDTNPVQLAIFMKLSRLCKKTYWVGDLKQSIYGFRGSDPGLMDSVMKWSAGPAENGPDKGANDKNVLKSNWRSVPGIVEFNNAVFIAGLHDDGIPRERNQQEPKWPHPVQGKAIEGEAVEVWNVGGKNASVRAASVAQSINQLIQSDRKVIDRNTGKPRGIRPGDIAILLRTGKHVADFAKALDEFGVATAVEGGKLLQQSEVVLALAAYRYLIDPKDGIAASELAIAFGVEPDRVLKEVIEVQKSRKSGERSSASTYSAIHSSLQALSDARVRVRDLGVREKLDLAIAVAGVDVLVGSMARAEERHFHLSALRQLALRYEEHCLASFIPCSDPGFLQFLEDEEPAIPAAAHSGAVNVMTYHAAKGLEWPVVILGSLATAPPAASLFSTTATTRLPGGGGIDPENPLNGRVILDLAWPFGGFEKLDEINRHLAESQEQARRIENQRAENRRLLYVGMTRAKERLILLNERMVVPSADVFLGALEKAGASILEFQDRGDCIKIEGAEHPCKVVILAEANAEQTGMSEPDPGGTCKVLPESKPIEGEGRRLHLQPSKLSKSVFPGQGGKIRILQSGSFGTDLLLSRTVQEDDRGAALRRDELGTAVHLFFASDEVSEDRESRLQQAKDIITRWAVSSKVAEDRLVASVDRFSSWHTGMWPEGKLHREVPIEFELDGSIVSGSMDALILTDREAVIIDHKASETRLGEAEALAETYQPQLLAYQEAVKRAFPKHTVSTFLHNPDGWWVEVGW
jgi:ATP-dependent helicase/nuclease subunit A